MSPAVYQGRLSTVSADCWVYSIAMFECMLIKHFKNCWYLFICHI